MFKYPEHYEVIVIGAGHAGIEAALAASRLGCSTLLLTSNLDTVGQMSCNPAIGGLAKGHLVREIDALGGEMARCTDLTGIHFRMLNTSKGPAVRAPRAQCDKRAYQIRMKWVCERQSNLNIKQAQVSALHADGGQVLRVDTAMGVSFEGDTFIITTGTFLHGLMHIGQTKQSGGRMGDSVAVGISESLRAMGMEILRFKTGTPPRLNRRTIEFDSLEEQRGDHPIQYFSHWNDELFHVEQSHFQPAKAGLPGSLISKNGGQVSCYLTQTTDQTSKIIHENLDRSPLFSGIIEGTGPRYCPSIEDKVVRFNDKKLHQLFLEPEGLETDEIYINGLSTSLPYDVQIDLVRSVIGCEKAEILRPAYAVEYDYCNPIQLDHSLRARCSNNLFLAGQINGTSGYEEAAAQGMVAGINAARLARDLGPIHFKRDESYIGVLIDDLVTVGTSEPYRMFTSRAENRLFLRQDNADLRLSALGFEVGLLSKQRADRVEQKRRAVVEESHRLANTRTAGTSLLQILRRPGVQHADLPQPDMAVPGEVAEQVEIMAKYSGYLDRQSIENQKWKKLESMHIPNDFDFDAIGGLRIEARQKLGAVRPTTLRQASRISGVTPADVSLLAVMVRRSGMKI